MNWMSENICKIFKIKHFVFQDIGFKCLTLGWSTFCCLLFMHIPTRNCVIFRGYIYQPLGFKYVYFRIFSMKGNSLVSWFWGFRYGLIECFQTHKYLKPLVFIFCLDPLRGVNEILHRVIVNCTQTICSRGRWSNICSVTGGTKALDAVALILDVVLQCSRNSHEGLAAGVILAERVDAAWW